MFEGFGQKKVLFESELQNYQAVDDSRFDTAKATLEHYRQAIEHPNTWVSVIDRDTTIFSGLYVQKIKDSLAVMFNTQSGNNWDGEIEFSNSGKIFQKEVDNNINSLFILLGVFGLIFIYVLFINIRTSVLPIIPFIVACQYFILLSAITSQKNFSLLYLFFMVPMILGLYMKDNTRFSLLGKLFMIIIFLFMAWIAGVFYFILLSCTYFVGFAIYAIIQNMKNSKKEEVMFEGI